MTSARTNDEAMVAAREQFAQLGQCDEVQVLCVGSEFWLIAGLCRSEVEIEPVIVVQMHKRAENTFVWINEALFDRSTKK